MRLLADFVLRQLVVSVSDGPLKGHKARDHSKSNVLVAGNPPMHLIETCLLNSIPLSLRLHYKIVCFLKAMHPTCLATCAVALQAQAWSRPLSLLLGPSAERIGLDTCGAAIPGLGPQEQASPIGGACSRCPTISRSP